MTDIAQEISEDYDHDNMPVRGDHALDEEVINLENMEGELNTLCNAAVAVETYGINRTAFVALKTTGLLSGTSLDALAVENFGMEGAEGLETDMALEALVGKIQEKAAAWSARILTFTKSVVDKMLSAIGGVWTKITDAGKNLTAKAWDKAKSAGTTIKAHPYKTVIAAVGAVIAVAAIAALVASGSPGAFANESSLQSFIYRISDMLGKIKWPGGKIVSRVDGMKIIYKMEGDTITKVSESVDKLGWTQTAVKNVANQLGSGWTKLRSTLGTAGNTVVAVAKKINDLGGDAGTKVGETVAKKSGSKLLGWATGETVKKVYMTTLWAVVGTLYHILRDIALKTFQMVADTFRALKSQGQTEAKPA